MLGCTSERATYQIRKLFKPFQRHRSFDVRPRLHELLRQSLLDMGVGENMEHRMSARIRSRLRPSSDEHRRFLLQRLLRGCFFSGLRIEHVVKNGVVLRLLECRRVLQYLIDVVIKGPTKVGEGERVGRKEPDEPVRQREEGTHDDGKVLADTCHAIRRVQSERSGIGIVGVVDGVIVLRETVRADDLHGDTREYPVQVKRLGRPDFIRQRNDKAIDGVLYDVLELEDAFAREERPENVAPDLCELVVDGAE